MMRKSWTKWILIAVIALALIVGVPIIINECYKTNSGYMTMWGAADALAYYGTILGALVAVATVVVTILFTYKQIQRDSFLKSENEKWAKIEEIFAMALDTINPIRGYGHWYEESGCCNYNFPKVSNGLQNCIGSTSCFLEWC